MSSGWAWVKPDSSLCSNPPTLRFHTSKLGLILLSIQQQHTLTVGLLLNIYLFYVEYLTRIYQFFSFGKKAVIGRQNATKDNK